MVDSPPNPTTRSHSDAVNGRLARTVRRGIIGVVLFNAILLIVLLWPNMPPHARVAIDNILQCIGPLAAFICSLLGAWKPAENDNAAPRRHRGLWASLFLALGTLGYAVGQIIWTYYELALGRSTPFPSWADIGYLCAYPYLLIGILSLPTRPIPVAARLRVLFDSLMIMVALATFSWYFVLGPTLMRSGASIAAAVIGTAYPFFDMVMLSCVLLLFLRSRDQELRSLAILLATGLMAIIAVDVVFDYQTLHDTYQTGRIIDIGWPLGYMLVAVAARMVRQMRIAEPKETTDLGSICRISAPMTPSRVLKRIAANVSTFLPYAVIPAVGALVWHATMTPGDENLESGLYAFAAVLIVLLLVRQFMTVLENQQLAAQHRMFNENLEHAVSERTLLLSELADELRSRTEQLAALQRLTVAVNETLVVEQVVS
ncbi:MAG TPA: hypothetical protein VFW40_10650, partial [Capsulimonadaceae bacterium]|nr:hypothetical protein [Capsulimonadaceae bacterium]